MLCKQTDGWTDRQTVWTEVHTANDVNAVNAIWALVSGQWSVVSGLGSKSAVVRVIECVTEPLPRIPKRGSAPAPSPPRTHTCGFWVLLEDSSRGSWPHVGVVLQVHTTSRPLSHAYSGPSFDRAAGTWFLSLSFTSHTIVLSHNGGLLVGGCSFACKTVQWCSPPSRYHV